MLAQKLPCWCCFYCCMKAGAVIIMIISPKIHGWHLLSWYLNLIWELNTDCDGSDHSMRFSFSPLRYQMLLKSCHFQSLLRHAAPSSFSPSSSTVWFVCNLSFCWFIALADSVIMRLKFCDIQVTKWFRWCHLATLSGAWAWLFLELSPREDTAHVSRFTSHHRIQA